jgi:energy-coupling factor transport system permease protein
MKSPSPEIKILAYLALVVATMLIQSLWALSAIAALLSALTLFFAPKSLQKSAKIVSILLVFTFIANLFSHDGAVIYTCLNVMITKEGLVEASLITLRLLIMIQGAQLLNGTSTYQELLRALENLLGPVSKIEFVKDLLHTTALTFEMFPELMKEATRRYRIKTQEKPMGFKDKILLSASVCHTMLLQSLSQSDCNIYPKEDKKS